MGVPTVCVAAKRPTPTEEPFYATDFTMAMLNGGEITLSDLQGRWVLLNFWATWCIPCRVEMPALQDIASEYRSDLVVLGVNQRENPPTVQAFIDEIGTTFPILLNPDDATLAAYQVMSLPQTFLINPQGEILWRQFGPIELGEFRPLLESFISA